MQLTLRIIRLDDLQNGSQLGALGSRLDLSVFRWSSLVCECRDTGQKSANLIPDEGALAHLSPDLGKHLLTSFLSAHSFAVRLASNASGTSLLHAAMSRRPALRLGEPRAVGGHSARTPDCKAGHESIRAPGLQNSRHIIRVVGHSPSLAPEPNALVHGADPLRHELSSGLRPLRTLSFGSERQHGDASVRSRGPTACDSLAEFSGQ